MILENNRNGAKRVANRTRTRMWALGAGFAATLLGLPGHAALVIPPTPLQSATPIPPNIMFILDDSGSMESTTMPDDPSLTTPIEIQSRAYTLNTLSYNPNITYKAWRKADASVVAGGTSYSAAYSDESLASGSVNLSDQVQTFFVPKVGNTTALASTNLTQVTNYYRFQIKRDGTVERSEYSSGSPSVTALSQSGLTATANNWLMYQVAVPANARDLRIAISGGSGGDPDLYVRLNADPSTSNSDCEQDGNGRSHACNFQTPTAGNYHIGIRADNRNSNNTTTFSGLSLVVTYTELDVIGCDAAAAVKWINCTSVTPDVRDVRDATATVRTAQAEKDNYAIWYSFHRTRMKAAKAGASEAFGSLTGSKYRVGYTTIWDRQTRYIPVRTHNGLFEDVTGTASSTNRTEWFTRLHGAEGSGRTPLQRALNRIGTYFSDKTDSYKGATGPYASDTTVDGQTTQQMLACRQNYSILTTDGYWNDGLIDVGNADNTDGPEIGGKKTYTVSPPYKDDKSQTLADVAMHYWKNDLMPTMSNIVPTSTANGAFWQHMVTFGISIGLKGTLSQTTVADVLRDGKDGFTWPDPTDAEDEERIDDLLHAAVNGHGTFAVASNPQEFAQALQSALSEILARENSGSNVAISSSQVRDGSNTRAFVGKYKSGHCYGEVEPFPGTSSGVGATPTRAGLTTVPTTERSNVYTLGSSNGASVATFPTTDQSTALGSGVAAYIKGNRTGETGNTPTFRRRTHLLGDIVNSSPTYVKETSGTTTTETVYVGSNDGMMHAFNAADGTELFNYVPNLLDMNALKKIGALTNYEHQYFVDGPIVVSNRRQTPDKNYLVGTLGRGGKGLYGLDVTSPATFASTGKAWEYNGGNVPEDVADMGLVLGKPLIAKLNNGDMGVIVSNGINSTSGHAVLFVLNLTTGAKLAKIDTFKSGEVDNGLSVPTGVDMDGNGTVDYVYAGDLRGNVWKFDLSSGTASEWGVYGDADAPVYTATNSSGGRQPITGGVTVSFNPYTYTPWIFFGTGRYITAGDKEDLTVQTWYGMVDTGATGRSELKSRDIVVAGTITDQGGVVKNVRSFETGTANDMSGKKGWYVDLLTPPSDTPEGERMVGSQVVVGGSILVASSIIPQSSNCDVTGRGYVNAIDMFTGTAVTQPFFDANGDGSFNYGDTLKNGTDADSPQIPVGSIDLGVGMPSDPTVLENLVVVGGSKGSTGSVGIKQTIQDGRISWREILKD